MAENNNNLNENSLTVVSKKDEYTINEKINIYTLSWIFVIGCIVGVIVEVIYCFILTGHYENRSGVIYGPFNPVYRIWCSYYDFISC